jgi:hypothetical protein
MSTKYSKINFIYFMQKWMDSVPGQTFLNYAYSWGAAIVILGTLFKLTHLPGANLMLFIGMGTEVFVFFISAFDRPFDKSTIDMPLDNHMDDGLVEGIIGGGQAVGTAVVGSAAPVSYVGAEGAAASEESAAISAGGVNTGASGGVVIIGGGSVGGAGTVGNAGNVPYSGDVATGEGASANAPAGNAVEGDAAASYAVGTVGGTVGQPQPVITPAPAVTPETAERMQEVTEEYVDRLAELNEMLEKVGQLTSRLSVDSEEMENLNRTLTGIARVYEMQLKSASQQITTQDSINEQTRLMAEKITELNNIYARMIEAMTTNMPKA